MDKTTTLRWDLVVRHLENESDSALSEVCTDERGTSQIHRPVTDKLPDEILQSIHEKLVYAYSEIEVLADVLNNITTTQNLIKNSQPVALPQHLRTIKSELEVPQNMREEQHHLSYLRLKSASKNSADFLREARKSLTVSIGNGRRFYEDVIPELRAKGWVFYAVGNELLVRYMIGTRSNNSKLMARVIVLPDGSVDIEIPDRHATKLRLDVRFLNADGNSMNMESTGIVTETAPSTKSIHEKLIDAQVTSFHDQLFLSLSDEVRRAANLEGSPLRSASITQSGSQKCITLPLHSGDTIQISLKKDNECTLDASEDETRFRQQLIDMFIERLTKPPIVTNHPYALPFIQKLEHEVDVLEGAGLLERAVVTMEFGKVASAVQQYLPRSQMKQLSTLCRTYQTGDYDVEVSVKDRKAGVGCWLTRKAKDDCWRMAISPLSELVNLINPSEPL